MRVDERLKYLVFSLTAILAIPSVHAIVIPGIVQDTLRNVFLTIPDVWVFKFIYFIMLFAILNWVAQKIFGVEQNKKNKNTAIIIAFVIALTSTFFLPEEWVMTIFRIFGFVAGLLVLLAPILGITYIGTLKAFKEGDQYTRYGRGLRAVIFILGSYIIGMIGTSINELSFLGINSDVIQLGEVAMFASFIFFLLAIWNLIQALFGGSTYTAGNRQGNWPNRPDTGNGPQPQPRPHPPPPPQPNMPRAGFTWQPQHPLPGQPVQFTDTSTNSPNNWLWQFGDGTPADTRQHPDHVFAAAGQPYVTLSVRNSDGPGRSVQQITIGGAAPPGANPVVDFTWQPDTPTAGEEVQFTDRTTNHPVNFSWNFDDGHTSTDRNPRHRFTEPSQPGMTPRDYRVTLNVENRDGLRGSETLTIRVHPPQPSSWHPRIIRIQTPSGRVITMFGEVVE